MKFSARILCCQVLHGAWILIFGLAAKSLAADEGERFWSLQPVKVVAPSAVRDRAWPNSPIDQFILARLEGRGLLPAPAADRRTLMRRATFDLTGLPPTPEEIEEFLADDSPHAFARVVDRLLASPRYGERWGRHWLDVVRYADARDLIQLPAESDFREAWRYRDWVVNAFNRDLPYDQFVSQQVAGDLLQPTDPAVIDADAVVATGLLAIADFVPGDVDKEQMIADYVNDQIDVLGRALLGLTLACARCHDHKFDPISTADYYSLAGIFFSTRVVPGPVKGNTPLVRVPLLSATQIAAIEAGQARDKARIAELSRDVSTLGEREYRSWLERQVAAETQQYLLAAWECTHPPAGEAHPSAEEFAKARGLEAKPLERWIAYLEERKPHLALTDLPTAGDKDAAERLIRELAAKLSAAADDRQAAALRDPVLKSLTESVVLRFQADDRRSVANDARRMTFWPNRGHGSSGAMPVPGVEPPANETVMVQSESHTVLHFSGNQLLQVAGTVPATGSLFVVFRPDPAGPAGQRLVGWEDSAVGQHGVGIMTDGAGSVHAILRRNAANGDVVVAAPAAGDAAPGFQTLSITWGPEGVAVYRNGQAAGTNKGIDSVSSDPAIGALRIGGAGSGSSPRFQGDVAELRVYSVPLDEQARARVETELARRWQLPPENVKSVDHVADLYDELVSASSPFQLEGAERDRALPDFRQRLASLRDELEALQKRPPVDIPRAVAVQEGGPPGTPHEGFHDAKIFLRGNHAKPGETVPRGFPKAIAGAARPAIREGSGRRELARWLADPKHPLTARVMVNRVWQHHFGIGLVPTSANFGAMGERPSHPELLDFLATQFVASGWSVKSLHRSIMLSNVYQQTSASNAAGLVADPENRLLWRANRRRLEAEELRDSLLAVAGRLDLTPGGPAVQDVATPRRSMYVLSSRTGAKAAEFGPLFDAPDCSGIVERRSESIVAPQALFLMNDPLVTKLAKALAERVAREVPRGGDRQRIGRLYEITLGRPPLESEVEVGLQFLAETNRRDEAPATPTQAASATEAWTSYCRLLVCTNEFLYLD
jgi:hypothetical protein